MLIITWPHRVTLHQQYQLNPILTKSGKNEPLPVRNCHSETDFLPIYIENFLLKFFVIVFINTDHTWQYEGMQVLSRLVDYRKKNNN